MDENVNSSTNMTPPITEQVPQQQLPNSKQSAPTLTFSGLKINLAEHQISKDARNEIRNKFFTVLTTTIAVVAGLFWQTAITDTIKNFIPTSGAWGYELVVAVLVSIGAAVLLYFLSQPTKPS